MPSFTQRIPNLQQYGPVIEILLTPSTPFIQALNIAPSDVKAIKILAMIDKGHQVLLLVRVLQIN